MKLTQNLGISKQDFIELYPLADHEIFYRDPKSDVEFEERYLTNKLWRLNNLYTITNKMGEVIPFVMNNAQHTVYKASIQHARILILKSRQQGISTFWLISFFDDALFVDHLNVGLMSQGKDESGTLLTRTKLAWEKLDGAIKYFLLAALKKDNADELGLSNGSTIFIRTSFRSATLQRLHISEYGKICNKYPERAKETKTGSLQAIAPGNTCVIESTAEGINDFKYMWDKSYGKDLKNLGPKEFLAVFLSWIDDPTCVSNINREPTPDEAQYFAEIEEELGVVLTQQQKNFWIDQHKELEERGNVVETEDGQLSNSSIYQEYPSTPEEAFKALRDGTYYAHLYTKWVIDRKRRVPNLYDPNLSVEVAADLGMDDFFVLIFFQIWQGEPRIIHEYANNGHGIDHYAAYMRGEVDEENNPCGDYEITKLYLPWDASIRDITQKQGDDGRMNTRERRFHEEGWTCTLILPKWGVGTGIELVRKILPKLWIDETCEYVHACMLNYSKKWNNILQKWDDNPQKSDFNHGADAVRAIAVSRERGVQNKHSKSKSKERSNQVVDGLAM